MRVALHLAFVTILGSLAPQSTAQEGTSASGAMSIGKFTVEFKHVYLVAVAVNGKPERRLIFSANDIGAGIGKCTTVSCATSDLKEGLELEIDAGARMNLWAVANGQKVQHSDTAPRTNLTTTIDSGDMVAGTLAIDRSSIGGPKINVEFKAKLSKAYKG